MENSFAGQKQIPPLFKVESAGVIEKGVFIMLIFGGVELHQFVITLDKEATSRVDKRVVDVERPNRHFLPFLQVRGLRFCRLRVKLLHMLKFGRRLKVFERFPNSLVSSLDILAFENTLL